MARGSRALALGIVGPILIIGGVAFGFLVVRPQIASVKDNQMILDMRFEEQYDRESSLSSIKRLIADLRASRSQLDLVERAVPSFPDLPNLLANTEELAVLSGLFVEDIQFSIPEDDEDGEDDLGGDSATADQYVLTEIDGEIKVTGQQAQLMAFLLNLEQNLRLFDVQSIDFASSGGNSGSRSFSISITTYYQEVQQ